MKNVLLALVLILAIICTFLILDRGKISYDKQRLQAHLDSLTVLQNEVHQINEKLSHQIDSLKSLPDPDTITIHDKHIIYRDHVITMPLDSAVQFFARWTTQGSRP